MAIDTILLRRDVAKLYKRTNDPALKGWASMPVAELRAALAQTQPAKAATNGAAKVSTSTSAPAEKSEAQKTTPPKGKAAAQGEAKRPTAAVAASTEVRGVTPAKATPPSSPAKGKGAPAAAPMPAPKRKRIPAGLQAKPARNPIDASEVDWTLEWNGGRTGKRADVMNALRKYEGDYGKVFKALSAKAVEWYPNGGSAGRPESMLKWLIGRVAFDYVAATGQHIPGERTAYGEATDKVNVRRRARRAEQRENPPAPKRVAPAGRGKAVPVKGMSTAVARKAKGK